MDAAARQFTTHISVSRLQMRDQIDALKERISSWPNVIQAWKKATKGRKKQDVDFWRDVAPHLRESGLDPMRYMGEILTDRGLEKIKMRFLESEDHLEAWNRAFADLNPRAEAANKAAPQGSEEVRRDGTKVTEAVKYIKDLLKTPTNRFVSSRIVPPLFVCLAGLFCLLLTLSCLNESPSYSPNLTFFALRSKGMLQFETKHFGHSLPTLTRMG